MKRTRTPNVRWLFAIPVLALLGSTAFGGGADAAPAAQAGVSCAWERLDRGEDREQHSLVPLPGVGVLAYGGVQRTSRGATIQDDVHTLDLVGSPGGAWSVLNAGGSSAGKRAEHIAVLRPRDGGASQVVVYGGVDALESIGGGGGGTFTWRSPLTAGGGVALSRLGTFAPLGVVRKGFRLDVDAQGGAWTAFDPEGTSVALADAAAIYWPAEDALLVHGGRTKEEVTSVTNDLHLVTLGDSPTWSKLDVAGGPTDRFAHSAIYDAAGDRMVLFGGTRDWKAGLDDVYALDLSGGVDGLAWTKLEPTGRAPSRRFDHAAAWHPTLRWMVVFGGTRDGNRALSDAFVLDVSTDTPTWAPLDASGASPAASRGPAAAYSADSDALVFFGGQDRGTTRRDSWALRCTIPATPTPTEAPITATPTPEPATETPTPEPATETPTDVPATNTPQPPTETPTPEPPPAIYLPWGEREAG